MMFDFITVRVSQHTTRLKKSRVGLEDQRQISGRIAGLEILAG